ncbi:MAG: AAA family ATPase, partial [Desulfobacterales bacterium]|nr:AAA family ATPase [Desulfobacterales bacterium]
MNISLIERLRRTFLFDSIDLHFAEFIYSKENEAVKEITPFFAAVASSSLNKGHICVNLKDFLNQLLRNEEVSDSEAIKMPDVNEWKKTIELSDTIGNIHEYKPLLYDGDYLYLNKFYHYELNVFQKIIELCSSKETFKLNYELLNSMFDNQADIMQKNACHAALENKFCVISGGPGTGKTTIIAKMLYLLLFENQNLKIALATPTGKASARMNEAIAFSLHNIKEHILNKNPEFLKEEIINKISKTEARTIHRLLETFGNYFDFVHNRDNTLYHDIFIIDEASMIDIALVSKLFDAIKPSAKIILIGDKNQLSSVEAGSFFSDICESAEDNGCFINK